MRRSGERLVTHLCPSSVACLALFFALGAGGVYVAASVATARAGGAARGPLSFTGCIAEHGAAGCVDPAHESLANAYDVAVSPDGANVYAVSSMRALPAIVGNSITEFARAADGRLRQAGCVADRGAHGCARPAQDSLAGAGAVAVSPDGADVYVAAAGGDGGTGSITEFARAADGGLSSLGCIADGGFDGCSDSARESLDGPTGVAVSPDGADVYAVSAAGSITQFSRAPDGSLSEAGCIAGAGLGHCAALPEGSLAGAEDVALSADGADLYVLASGSLGSSPKPTVTEFARAADGSLAEVGCVAVAGAGGCTAPIGASLDRAEALAISPDGADVYVAGSAIAEFARAADGSLAETACISDRGGRGCSRSRWPALGGTGPGGIAVSPDGGTVYVAGTGSVLAARRGSGGALTELGCIADRGAHGCARARHASLGVRGIGVSPDGRDVYAASFAPGSVTALRRRVDVGQAGRETAGRDFRAYGPG